ncbi:hypothetical protein A2631_03805 [Candidatus Daviesbacteria bacterium RIFCSPHIGHO2_01_FULL_44_29]|uniref:Uncharacterized protein n=1 Tax=Candidatus Daviesbacteria bacterium RIFCSPHIGHO2_02_FULL_43_12 TaxID=1797776 RepID=A0A1F5KHR5_9BACT|nr:MAG: hypothetical protein A2631_03805 [Candidatus Daviesbacteria bacterium RIFCSPHIGHO2_01_FULL_44_29]OGE39803.1 MAG: hypothetical protein A3E86_04505 [Candidatus Daviesbacteria bacterium RIFCSPHIGHO2_12_FULL_47_45]OGE40483.1 MAG: hypothetical protein A3D25_00265 [Candidatus Daviesbacteria bacterium RIFCSPHIGHO2_02_FULL_43_12]OGE70034.1 MAG: hypothetical protein A3B55_05065 [Candidatus Daviesbacteria bacterium RIFCSPLOWO2_01_FULL_43_15]
MDIFALAAQRIIKEQQAIIGPIALMQAQKVQGLQVSTVDDIKIVGAGKDVLTNLVNQYAKLFGQTSIEVCREAFQSVSDQFKPADIPEILKN